MFYALTLAAGDINENLYISEALQGLIEYPVLIFCWNILNRKWYVKSGKRIILKMLIQQRCMTINSAVPADFKKDFFVF